jgi:hypothetical protein
MTNIMSAAEAAAKAKVDKSSIVRAIQAGKINANRNEFGDYEITPEELNKYRRRGHNDGSNRPSRAR